MVRQHKNYPITVIYVRPNLKRLVLCPLWDRVPCSVRSHKPVTGIYQLGLMLDHLEDRGTNVWSLFRSKLSWRNSQG